jgi:hypothetical protein
MCDQYFNYNSLGNVNQNPMNCVGVWHGYEYFCELLSSWMMHSQIP